MVNNSVADTLGNIDGQQMKGICSTGNTDLSRRVLVENSEDSHFCCDGFSRAGWCSEQHVGVSMVERVEDLRLNGIVMGKLIQTLILPVAQRCHGQWL